jgi:hypothetical protein
MSNDWADLSAQATPAHDPDQETENKETKRYFGLSEKVLFALGYALLFALWFILLQLFLEMGEI